MCLDDVCLKNARCNDKIECLHGEDEYRCSPQGKIETAYRGKKKMAQFITLELWKYPSPTELLEKNHPYPRGKKRILDSRILRILQILSDPVDSHGFSRILMDSRGFFWLLMDSRIYFRIYFSIVDGAFVINDSHLYLVNDL